MHIYVGNLPVAVTDEKLKTMFEPFGTVRGATIGKDKKTGDSQGYGFVDMPVKSEGRTAIEALRGKEMEGKPLLVRALKPGDEFHQHALNLQGAAHGGGGKVSARQIQTNVGTRAAGAVRRGGQRGS